MAWYDSAVFYHIYPLGLGDTHLIVYKKEPGDFKSPGSYSKYS